MPDIRLVIFDWDGTLADSTGAIVRAMQHAAPICGLPVPEPAAVLDIIGLGLPEAIFRIWPEIDAAQMAALRDAYSRHYIAEAEYSSRLFPGVEATLSELRGYGMHLAVATGKSRRGLDRALGRTGLAAHFVVTRCADEGAGKPDPEMLHRILEHTGTDPEQAVMVGDTEYDLDMAARAGMPAVGVSFGAHDAERLLAYNPIAILERIADLVPLLLAEGVVGPATGDDDGNDAD